MATVAKPRARQYTLSHADAQARTAVKHIVQLEAEDPRGFDWEDGCRERERLECGLGARSSGLVMEPSFEELYDAIEADDRQFYAEHEAGR